LTAASVILEHEVGLRTGGVFGLGGKWSVTIRCRWRIISGSYSLSVQWSRSELQQTDDEGVEIVEGRAECPAKACWAGADKRMSCRLVWAWDAEKLLPVLLAVDGPQARAADGWAVCWVFGVRPPGPETRTEADDQWCGLTARGNTGLMWGA